MRRTIPLLILIASIPIGALLARGRAADVREIVKKTKALYDATTTAEVKFEQRGDGGAMSGTLQYARGNKYRLEMPQQTIVSDGNRTWRYIAPRKQVVVSKASKMTGRLTPGEILTSFPGDYRAELTGEQKINGHNVWTVRCTAGASKIGDVTQAILYIDQSTYRFHRIDITSPSMGQLTIEITSAKYNTSIPASRFTFAPPQGAKVIDLSR